MLGLVLALLACEESDETSWEQYNADGESVTVSVGAAELAPAASVVLYSTTGEVEVGSASVDPAGGPIGTTHTVRVEVVDAYADDVGRASVRTSSPDRGEDEYDLDADSTGEGIFKLEIVSQGTEGETREDTLTFRLWTEVEGSDSGG